MFGKVHSTRITENPVVRGIGVLATKVLKGKRSSIA